MADTFFIKSERKANIDHETICRMSAYESNLLLSFLYPEDGKPRDRRILGEIAHTSNWLTNKLTK